MFGVSDEAREVKTCLVNQALGNARDDVQVITRLATYLHRSRSRVRRVVSEEYRAPRDVVTIDLEPRHIA